MRPSLAIRLLLTLVACASLTAATPAPAQPPITFSDDGAWCWFSDPRAIYHDGHITAGWISTDGSVKVGSRPLAGIATALTAVTNLAPQFERDDHNHPALLPLATGETVAFFAPHAHGDMHVSHTRGGAWQQPRTLGLSDPTKGRFGTTYANPFLLPAESDRLFLFWRGDDFKPTVATSPDHGQSWTTARTLISEVGADSGNRPYVKYASNGDDAILLAFTDGHPRNEPHNGVLFARYTAGRFERADGTLIGTMDALPIQPVACDRVYDGASAGRAWIWSVAADADGHPVIAYTRHPTEEDHRYRYARWNGTSWEDHALTAAGQWFPHTPEGAREPEPHYSAGLALDPADPSIVYLARPVNGVFEIERWQTPDGGASWTSQAITENSTSDNVRPYVVPGTPDGTTVVMWMHLSGGYRHYTHYQSEIHLTVLPPDTEKTSP